MGKLNDLSIVFTRQGKKVEFRLHTDLRETTIEAAFVNWSFRTKKFTIKSFCNYVTSKDCGAVCKPYKEPVK